MTIQLTEAQLERVNTIANEPTQAALIADETGYGKQQPVSEPVLTPEGWKPIGDLHIGDFVVDAQGQPTRVTGIFPQEDNRVYRVTFNDGSWTRAGAEHLWAAQTKAAKSLGHDWRVLTTEVLMNSLSLGWHIPMTEPVNHPEKPLNVDPYLLGVYLGDGFVQGHVRRVCTDREIIEALNLGTVVNSHESSSQTAYATVPKELWNAEPEAFFGRAWEKKIPEAYMLGSIEQRHALLQGLFDTDGSPKNGGGIEFSTTSPEMFEQVCELVESLGGVARCGKTRRTRYTHKGEVKTGRVSYRVNVKLPNELAPFRLQRKIDKWVKPTKYPVARIIENIEFIGHEESVCISVDNPEHLYLTRHHIVTHNTLTALGVAERLKADTVLVIAPLGTFGGWKREVKRIMPDMPVFEILAKDKNNKNLEQLKNRVRGVYLIGREFMALAATTTETRAARWRWAAINKSIDIAIFDEVHAASNRKTTTFQALQTIKPQMLRLAMSATPGGEKFQGLWSVTRWLWPDIIDRSFWRWASTWAQMGFNPHSSTGREVMGELNPGAFVASLPCYFRGMAEKVPVDTYRVKVALTPKQQEQYDSMLKSAIAWLDENPLVADLPIVQKIRLRQMLLGEVAFNEDGEVDFPQNLASSKADAVLKIIDREPAGTPMLILTDSRRFAERLNQTLCSLGYVSEPWTGGQTKNAREATKERFMAGETQFVVATISRAFSEGVDGLQKICSTEIWCNKSFSSLMNEQAEGRLNRQGQKAERITRYELYVPGTADEEDWQRNARKVLARTRELATPPRVP